jgi:hypothetical protein
MEFSAARGKRKKKKERPSPGRRDTLSRVSLSSILSMSTAAVHGRTDDRWDLSTALMDEDKSAN